MKTLLLLRHGKAGPDRSGDDHDRRLTERGRRDAIRMGVRALELADGIDLIVTSDAVRARETADLAVEGSGHDLAIRLEPAIYQADVGELLALVQRLPDNAETVMMVGHNPGFLELANMLVTNVQSIQHLPTAGLVTLTLPVDSWRQVRSASATLVDLTQPREPQSVPESIDTEVDGYEVDVSES